MDELHAVNIEELEKDWGKLKEKSRPFFKYFWAINIVGIFLVIAFLLKGNHLGAFITFILFTPEVDDLVSYGKKIAAKIAAKEKISTQI